MKRALCLIAAGLTASAHADKLQTVALPQSTVIAVASASNAPADYAAAYGKLVGFYAKPGHAFKVIFPQLSLSLQGKNYAAIAIEGKADDANGEVKVLQLPACRFMKQRYVGNYPGIGPAVQTMIGTAMAKGYSIDDACGIRILHRNSPDNTPVEKLIHDIHVPVKRKT